MKFLLEHLSTDDNSALHTIEILLCVLLKNTKDSHCDVKNQIELQSQLMESCCEKYEKLLILFSHFGDNVIGEFVKRCGHRLKNQLWFCEAVTKIYNYEYDSQEKLPDHVERRLARFSKESDFVIARTIREATLTERTKILLSNLEKVVSEKRLHAQFVLEVEPYEHIKDYKMRETLKSPNNCDDILRNWVEKKSYEDEDFWRRRNIALFVETAKNESWYVASRLMSPFTLDETETKLVMDELDKLGITFFAEMKNKRDCSEKENFPESTIECLAEEGYLSNDAILQDVLNHLDEYDDIRLENLLRKMIDQRDWQNAALLSQHLTDECIVECVRHENIRPFFLLYTLFYLGD